MKSGRRTSGIAPVFFRSLKDLMGPQKTCQMGDTSRVDSPVEPSHGLSVYSWYQFKWIPHAERNMSTSGLSILTK